MRPEINHLEKDIRKTVLENGLRIVTERVQGVRSVSLGVWVEAGSTTDSVEKMGLAHFIEHMMFKGTRRRTSYEIANSLESVGGSLDAFTTRDMTCFSAYILDEHFPLAMDVISDIMINSIFDSQEIVKEKKVVLEEITSSEDIPEELAQDSFSDMLLNPYPESKPILGTRTTVSSIQKDDILDYISNYYTAPNIVISAAGNLEHENFFAFVTETIQFQRCHQKKGYK